VYRLRNIWKTIPSCLNQYHYRNLLNASTVLFVTIVTFTTYRSFTVAADTRLLCTLTSALAYVFHKPISKFQLYPSPLPSAVSVRRLH